MSFQRQLRLVRYAVSSRWEATAKMSMPHQNDVLFLVVQYLQARGFYTSSLALQQESGLDVAWLRGYSHEVALLRRWVFAGDVKRARSLLQPLTILSEVSEEMKAALLALDELEMMMKTQTRESPQLAKAKLKCFECLVTLFRDPVGEDENNVFKYIAMPKLQLIALIHDAVLFHRQTGDETAQDCISMKCSVYEDDLVDKEDEIELLRLDGPFGQIPVDKYEIVPAKVANVTHSVEWMNLQRKQRNPLVSSVNFGRHQPQDTFKVREFEEEPLLETINVATSCDFDANETVDAAVSCDVEMIDTAVSCELDVKETADAAVSCEPEIIKTVDAGVNCGPDEWTDAATQTENFQKINENEDECLLKDRECNGKVEEQHERHSNSSFGESIGHHFQPNDRFQPNREEHQSDHEQMNIATNSTSNTPLAASWARKSSYDAVMNSSNTMEAGPEVDQSEMDIEYASPREETRSIEPPEDLDDKHGLGSEMPLSKGPPQCYAELKLDHIVCASIIAEVKEPQAVRALDMHPTGTHLAVGTNARALRVFDLFTPLHQRHQQLSWSPLNLILPLLPVALERHKHHDSGIYCVSYNQHLLHQAGTASMIASGAADGSVKILTTKNMDSIQKQVDELCIQRGDTNGSMGKTRALQFASPHLLWVTSTSDRRLRCLDIRRTQRNSTSAAFQTLDGHVGEIQAIAMPHPSASGLASTLLLSAALDNTVRLWDTRSRRCERLVTSGVHPAFSLDFHPTDEKLVVSGHQDGSVSLWDLRSTTREALQVVLPHQDECRSVRWSPDGQWLLSAAFDGTLCIMQTNPTLQPVASYHKHSGKVLQAQWHPTEPAFVSSGADKRVKLWSFA